MTLNELMIRQNFIGKILLKEGNDELSKDLKVKIMKIRIELSKIRKQLDEDIQEAIKGLTPDGFQELSSKQDKTEEEQQKLKDLTDKINDEYSAFVASKGNEEVTITLPSFTEDEYAEILEVNAGNDVTINNQKIDAADFLEIIHNLFVVA